MDKYQNIYDYYRHKLIAKLCQVPLRSHYNILKDKTINVGVFDFCGKIKILRRHFEQISQNIYLVIDGWEDMIFDMLDQFDIVYIIDDIEMIYENVFYMSLSRPSFIFIVYDGSKFLRIEKGK